MKLVTLFKNNIHILTTSLCLLFILIGILLLQIDLEPFAAPAFILAFLIGGYQSAKDGLSELIFNKHLSVDVLMILAAIGSGIIGYWMEGALLIFIFSLSNTLEELAMEKSRNAIASLMNMTPPTARKIEENGDITVLETADIHIGDFLQVRKGDTVPLDGRLMSNQSIFDESMITGEPLPAEKLMGATVIGRDLGPRVSSALTSGLTADCTSLEIGDHEDKKEGKTYKNLLYQIRPAFGGNIVATIVNPEHRPQMATVREGVMKKEILSPTYQGEVIRHDVKKYVADTDYVVKVIERHVEKAKNNLKGSPIIIAGGYGVGSKENFNLLFDLAKELHAEVGASRAAVDAGFADHDRQIGQTGVTVRPKLYIACGISGQIQHIAGMQESGIIISINNDPDAPINTIADYVINGTIEEVVPKMIKYYKQNSK